MKGENTYEILHDDATNYFGRLLTISQASGFCETDDLEGIDRPFYTKFGSTLAYAFDAFDAKNILHSRARTHTHTHTQMLHLTLALSLSVENYEGLVSHTFASYIMSFFLSLSLFLLTITHA